MLACGEIKSPDTKIKEEIQELKLSDSLKVIEYYKGIIPCSDCKEILQQLWLMRKELSDSSGIYLLRETYRDGIPNHEQVINTRGVWGKNYRTNEDGQMIIIELAGDSTTGYVQRFYEAGITGIVMLNAKGKRIQSKLNYRLDKLPW